MGDAEVNQAYSDFIQAVPWDYYSTVTFRRNRRDSIAASGAVCQALSTLGASRIFLAVESHQSGFLHCHALSRHLLNPTLRPQSAYRYLFKAFGRTSVEPIRELGAVSDYCAKYVTKGNEYSFWGRPVAWTGDTLTRPSSDRGLDNVVRELLLY